MLSQLRKMARLCLYSLLEDSPAQQMSVVVMIRVYRAPRTTPGHRL